MLRNYLAAALRNLARNRLYAGVTIAGLAIGFAAAMLIGLYVRHEFTYDRFIPGHEQVYQVAQTIVPPGGGAPIESLTTPMMMARPLKEEFSEVAWVARLTSSYFPPDVRRGETTTAEAAFFWGDPDLFKVLPLPVVAGDLDSALEAPDGLVLTREMALKYFGKDAPIGEALNVNREPMRVMAVVENLPSNSHLVLDFIGSAKAAQSPISQYEAINSALTNTLMTYVRLKPGASLDTMAPRFAEFLDRRLPLTPDVTVNGKWGRTLHLIPLTQIHLWPATQGSLRPPAQPAVIAGIGIVGLLIIVVAAINFVTLMTARAARRAVEVGVRKAAGATRRDLVLQFMGEALVYVLLSGVLAVAIAELTLPAFNAYLQRKMAFDYLGDPALAGILVGVLLATALLAGAYPAFVLSSFRPAAVLKGGPAPATGGAGLRQVLVVVQFAVLVTLVLGAITIARQTLYALNEGMRVNQDQVVLVFQRPCSEPMRDEVRQLTGVRGAACASAALLNLADNRMSVTAEGRKREVAVAGVDFGSLELFGVRPIAGRLFDRNRPGDAVLDSTDVNPPVVLNESGARRLGFASPQQAIGKTVIWPPLWDETMRQPTYTAYPRKPSQVIGVVPDFGFGSVRQEIEPAMFAIARNAPPNSIALAVKLNGAQTKQTLDEIDRIWKRVSGGAPVLRMYANLFTMRLYLDTIVQGVTIIIAALVALSIACLGLFALSAYTTERRTKEIGVRKAMGASSGDILKLLMWQFTKPVLWANLIAWPLAWLVLDGWLKGFARHVDIAPWTFVAAAVGAIAIAWGTVFVHALKVARAKPVGALRDE
jgi:putative ABC transport system permease protein